jgi:pimeloyl-ACP methyl ester carboxylesterase
MVVLTANLWTFHFHRSSLFIMLATNYWQPSFVLVLCYSVALASPLGEARNNSGVVLTASELGLPFEASFSTAIIPFNISVDESFINMTTLKASLTRFVDDTPGQKEFTDGPPKRIVQDVATFWTSEYSWRDVEAGINAKFKRYTTLVTVPDKFGDTPIPLHFAHHPSPREDAIPLLFIHGWPGSFLEIEPLIDSLTHPPNSSFPAFHVVAPSLPGYEFSPSLLKAGLGARFMGGAFNELMQKLGYAAYITQGGDFGAIVGRVMAADLPDAVVGLHSYFWVMNAAQGDLERYIAGTVTGEEKAFIETNQRFNQRLWPTFGTLSSMRPRKLSVALADSPLGLAMWIYDLLAPVTYNSDEVWVPERVITWTMMQWIPGVYATLAIAENLADVSTIFQHYFCPFLYLILLLN